MASIFLNNILPRIKQFSSSLDQKELFVDKPWAVIDEDLNQQKYIFRRSGELIMSLNGQVSMGSWEYLPEAKCLLLDRGSDKILLNHNFLDPAVMILKKDGFRNENLILANEVLIPDLDVANYLQMFLENKLQKEKPFTKKVIELVDFIDNVETIETVNGEKIEIKFTKSSKLNDAKIFKDGKVVKDGTYELFKGKFYETKNGDIVSSYSKHTYKTKMGIIAIKGKIDNYLYQDGDQVFLKGKPAPDGKYKLGFLEYIIIEEGKIKSKTLF